MSKRSNKMAKIRVFEINKNGKIELNKSELETILNEVYNEGKTDGKSELWTWTPPYYNYISTSTTPLNTTDKFTYDLASSDSTSSTNDTIVENHITGNESTMKTTTMENPPIKTVFCDNPASISKILGQFFSEKEGRE